MAWTLMKTIYLAGDIYMPRLSTLSELNRPIVTLCITALILLSVSNKALGHELYELDEIRNVKDFFERQIQEHVIKESIEPALTLAQLKTYKGIKIDFPTQSTQLLEFYAKGDTVTLPIPSLMFLEDLVVAYLWPNKTCPGTVFIYQYANMMQHNREALFKGFGKYLNPIDALGIPSPNTGTLAKMNPEFGDRFDRVFYGTLLFITAHEIGHILKRHKGSSLTQEKEADDFALDILARRQIDPSGVMVFFLVASLLLPNDVEHPMNGERIRAAGAHILNQPKQYYPNTTESDPRFPLLKEIGSRLIKVGNGVDKLAKEKDLPEIALNTNVAELQTCQGGSSKP